MKDILKDKKKVLIIILTIIVVIILVVAIFMLTKNDNSNSNKNNNSNNNPSQVEGDGNTSLPQTKPTEVSTFEVSNFEVKKNTPNEVNMVFKIINKSKEDIKGKTLDINMYNGDELLYTYGYVIEDLKIEEYMYVQANANFTYDKITKFEFQIDDKKVSIDPTYVD